MKSMDLLETIGSIRDKYILEAHSQNIVQKKRIPSRRLFLIAAIIALMLLLVGCVAYILGLKDMYLGEYTYDAGFEETGVSNSISLQGFVGTPNYQAAKEWQDYLAAYDQDGKLLKEADQNGYISPMEYMAYLCYTPEMETKIDDICDKYGLQLLGPTYLTDNPMRMFTDLGINNIIADGTVALVDFDGGAYYYGDGTFQVPVTSQLTWEGNPWPHPVNYTYRCVMKTAFDGVALNVGDLSQYDEWTYTVKDGTEVLLTLSQNKALIIADLPTHFVTVNILKPSDGAPNPMDRKALEAIADTFRFDYMPQKPDPDTLVEPEWFTEATEPENVTIPPENTVTVPINDGSWEEAKAKFESILSGESVFLDRDLAEGVTIQQYCESFGAASEVNVSITKYTTADMDADGIPELLLWITINDVNDYGVLVLRYGGGATGYTFAYRQMADIKTDGTFHYSGGASNHGIARLKFGDFGWEYVIIGGVEETDSVTSFYWNGEPVDEDVFWVCFEAQSEKEDVEWFPYPSDNYMFD